MRKLILLLSTVFFPYLLLAQAPPQIPLTGNIGVQGSVAVLGGLTVQMTADANMTLTPAQWSNKTLVITSAVSLSATRSVIAPLTKGQEFNVENTTTGGQSVIVIGATGTGVTIANGTSASVFSDGTNYIASAQLPTALALTSLKLGASSVLTGASGTGTKLASYSGSFTALDIPQFNAAGDLIDSGIPMSGIPFTNVSNVWHAVQGFGNGLGMLGLAPATTGNNFSSAPMTFAASICATAGCGTSNAVWQFQAVPRNSGVNSPVDVFMTALGNTNGGVVGFPAGTQVGASPICTTASGCGTGGLPVTTALLKGNNAGSAIAATVGVDYASASEPIGAAAQVTATAALPKVGTVLASQVVPFQGTVVPVFQTVASFDNLGAALGNPFCVASGGGLVACTQGTLASGYRRLPREANTSRVTRTDWQVIWDPTDTTGTVTLGIGLSTGLYNVTLSNTASGTMQAVFAGNGAGTTTTVAGVVGTSPLTLTVSVVTGNGGVTLSVLPQGAQIAQAAPDPWLTYQSVWQKMIQPRVTAAYFANSSATSKIMGWLHNSNGLDGDPNGVLLTRTVARNLAGFPNPFLTSTAILSNTSHENLIVIPERANPGIPLKAVMFFHGRTSYAPTDFTQVPGTSVPGETTDATAVALEAAGYAIVADQGGNGFTNLFADYWGNIRGTTYAKETLDSFTKNVFNAGKVYALGQSLGGDGSLNFIRQYPNVIAAAYEATPAIDLNDTSCPLGLNCAGGTLQASINNAYQVIYVSQVGGNIGNNPITDSGANWQILAEAGANPDVGGISWSKTTVATATTNNANVPVASGVGFAPGDYVYFENSRLMRRIVYGASGAPNTLVLDSPVTVLVGDVVRRITKQSNGAPDPNSVDFSWANPTFGWVAGTTYASGAIVFGPSNNEFNDEIAWNPQRNPESFGVTPIDIGIAGDGTCTGNDGFLANATMCAFADAVNAIYPSMVTETHYAGTNGSGHVSQAMVPANIIAFFAAH